MTWKPELCLCLLYKKAVSFASVQQPHLRRALLPPPGLPGDLQLPDFPAAEEQKNHPLPLQLTCQCTRQSYSTKPTFWPHSPPSAFHRRKKVRHTSWLTRLVSNSEVSFEFLFFSAPQSQELIFTSLTMPKHCDAAATWLMSVCLRDFQWGVH